MDRRFQLLDSFPARGSDGAQYKVLAYEQLRRDESLMDGQDHWESTGVAELRLASGELIDVKDDGTMRVVNSGLELKRA